MSHTQCLINACNLEREGEPTYIHGDLFRQGQTLIINAITDGKTGSARLFSKSGPRYHNLGLMVTIPRGADFWERRGVLIMQEADVYLSDEARAYIEKWS